MPSKEYEDMLAQAKESADDDVDVEPVGRRPSVPMEAPVEPVKAAATVKKAEVKTAPVKPVEVKAAPVKPTEVKTAPAKPAESTRKPIIEMEGPGADRRRAIGEGLKSAAKSVGDYFSGLGKQKEQHGTYRNASGKMVSYKSGGSVSSASSRGDGIAQRGKTRGKVC
jgi:hypothetical protein